MTTENENYSENSDDCMMCREHVPNIIRTYNTYIAGALTIPNSAPLRRFYEKLGNICNQMGFPAYVPHKYSDPYRFPDISARDLYEMDYDIVASMKLFIAYIGEGSLGIGTQVEIAKRHKVPVVLLYEKGKLVSRYIRGNPSVIKIIEFEDEIDALRQLKEFLMTFE